MAGKRFRTQLDGMKARVPVYCCLHCTNFHLHGKPDVCVSCGSPEFVYFGSKTEATRFPQLKLLRDFANITHLEFQPAFPIVHNGIKICIVKADFAYMRNGTRIVEDVKAKGAPLTRAFTLGKKLVAAFHGVDITVVRI